MGLKSKLKQYFVLGDDEELEFEYNKQKEPFIPTRKQRKQNVVNFQSVQQSSKVVLIEPCRYAEVQEIADQLKNHRGVVINFQQISHEEAKRIIDFLSGTVYALGGDLKKIGTDTFLCVPDHVDVSGTISEVSHESEDIKDAF